MALINLTTEVSVNGSAASPTRINTLFSTIKLKRGKGVTTPGYVYAYLPPASDGETLILQFWSDRIFVKVPGDVLAFPGSVYTGLAPAYTLSMKPNLTYLAYELTWRGGMYYIVSGS